jgi:hypothetical protein
MTVIDTNNNNHPLEWWEDERIRTLTECLQDRHDWLFICSGIRSGPAFAKPPPTLQKLFCNMVHMQFVIRDS